MKIQHYNSSNTPFTFCKDCPDLKECDFTECMDERATQCDKPIYHADVCDNCHLCALCFPDLMTSMKRLKAKHTRNIGAYKSFLKRNNID